MYSSRYEMAYVQNNNKKIHEKIDNFVMHFGGVY